MVAVGSSWKVDDRLLHKGYQGGEAEPGVFIEPLVENSQRPLVQLETGIVDQEVLDRTPPVGKRVLVEVRLLGGETLLDDGTVSRDEPVGRSVVAALQLALGHQFGGEQILGIGGAGEVIDDGLGLLGRRAMTRSRRSRGPT